MADKNEKEPVDLEWKEPLYGEIFSERTQKLGRNLLLVAVATLLVSVFEVEIKSISALPIDFSRQPAALEIFLAAINVGLLMAFVLRVSTDYLRAREDWANLVRFFAARRVKDAFKKAHEVDTEIAEQQYDQMEWDPDPWFEEAIALDAAAKKRIAELDAQFGDRKLPRAIRHARLCLFGAGPLIVGLIAFIHTSGRVLEFVLAVVGVDR